MKTYISILRGINVSGQKKILMSDLKTLYEDSGFTNVVTYIQSGNVVFNYDKKINDLAIASLIQKAIAKKYQFEVPVIIRSTNEIGEAISLNPFIKDKKLDTERMYVTFLENIPDQNKIDLLKNVDYSPDKFIIIKKEIFMHCPSGYGNTKLSNNFFENKLKVKATTRNWNTVNKLLELATNN